MHDLRVQELKVKEQGIKKEDELNREKKTEVRVKDTYITI